MMKRILATNPDNWPALIARIAIAVAIFPHGAQKLLGWFGGGGFGGSMHFFTQTVGLPWIIGFLVILIEFFGTIFLFFGFITRIAALCILGNFLGVVLSAHFYSGFFMNWGMAANKPEGLEYFVLLFGLAVISLLAGGGKASIDAAMIKVKTRPLYKV